MPLKLSIGISRKVGEPNFGSRGATVGLELEVDSALASQPREFQARVAALFRLAQASVDRELGSRSTAEVSANGPAANGIEAVRGATANQLRTIQAMVAERRFDLSKELRDRFDCGRLADLTLPQASELISALKAVPDVVLQPS